MKTRTSILLLTMSCLIFSCKKKKNESVAETPATPASPAYNYMPLKIGNYWIYDQYTIDPSGNETYNTTDSVYIAKDTTIAAVNYFVLENGGMAPYATRIMIRQSGSDIVTPTGTFYYKHNDTLTVLEDYYQVTSPSDTISYNVSRMGQINKTTTVSAGTFTTSSYNTHVTIWPSYITCCSSFLRSRRFAENTGVVSENMLQFVSGTHIDRRLKRFHLN